MSCLTDRIPRCAAALLLTLLLALTALALVPLVPIAPGVPVVLATGTDSGDADVDAIRTVNATFVANYERNAAKFELRRTVGYVVFVGAILFGGIVTLLQAVSAGGKRLDNRLLRVLIAVCILVMTIFVGTRDTLFPTNPSIYSSAAASIRKDLGNYRTEAEDLILVLGGEALPEQAREHRTVRARYRERMDAVIAAMDRLEKNNLPTGQPAVIALVPVAVAAEARAEPTELLPPDDELTIYALGAATAPALAPSTEAAQAAARDRLAQKLSDEYLTPLEQTLGDGFRDPGYASLRERWLADTVAGATVHTRRLEKTPEGIRASIVVQVPKRDVLAAYLHEVVLTHSVALPSAGARTDASQAVQGFLQKSKGWSSVQEFQLEMQK